MMQHVNKMKHIDKSRVIARLLQMGERKDKERKQKALQTWIQKRGVRSSLLAR